MTLASALTCPACGAPVRVSAAGRTLSVLCAGCGATLDAATPELKLLAQQAAELAVPAIPLGSRAELDGITWEVIGYLERMRADGSHSWQEYLLFNPWEGFIWLIDDEGFHIGTPVTRTPDAANRLAVLDGRDWHGLRRYQAVVTRAIGEFHWRVAAGETVAVAEYGRGDQLLAAETSGQERSWTLITPQPAGRIEAMFGLEPRNAESREWGRLRDEWLLHLGIAMAAMLAVVIIDLSGPAERTLASTRIAVPIDSPPITATLGPISVPAGQHRVAISTHSLGGLVNQWIDLDFELVNRRTQASYPVAAVAERYNGVSADGAWVEGDQNPLTTMASIPGGTYDLVIEADGRSWQPPGPAGFAQWQPRQRLIEVSISRDGSFGANLLLAALALFLWPALLFSAAHEDSDSDDGDEW